MSDTDADAGHKQYVVAIKDGCSADAVAADLTKIGMKVDRVLPKIGVVGGSGSADLWQAISRLPGVETVRHEGSVQLPPFDDRVPQ